MSNFAQNLSRIRRQQGLTQQDLAERLSLTFQAVSKWENGQSMPDLEQLTLMADLFSVSTDTLLGHTPRTASGQYESRYGQDGYYWGLEPSSMCYEVMKLLPPTRPLRVLDAGCGEGKDAVFFARNGYDVTAFDISEAGIAKARRLADACGVHVNLFRADILDFRPADEYDIIFSSGVLHYIPQPLRKDIFESLQAHTAPGGVHALNAFVQKPFIPEAPDEDAPAWLWRSGELAGLYADWRFHRFEEQIFDCESGGTPHQHCMDIIIAQKPLPN